MMSRRTAIVAAIGVTALLSLAGCSTTGDSLDAQLKASISAATTAELHTSLLRDGRAPASLAATGYGDVAKELDSAEQSVAQLAPTPHESELRRQCLDGIRQAVDAVLAAQQALDSGADLDAAQSDLRAVVTHLKALEEKASS